jgi:GT2 family glycosyltransferase
MMSTPHLMVKPESLNRELTGPRVSIIVVTLNDYEVSRECLLSLAALKYRNYEVVLVDNGSCDDSARRLALDFPEVRLLRSDTNLGFAGGNNLGMRDALARGADYLLLLNNDTIVDPEFLVQLITVAEADPRVGLLNPKIYFSDPPDRLWFAGGAYRRWWSFPKMVGVHCRDKGQYDQIHEIPFTTGCALLVRASLVREIGMLDEVFFLGFEDLDWTRRAAEAGFTAMYVPQARIWHRSSFLTKRELGKPAKDFYAFRNCILMARKHPPGWQWPLFVASLAWKVAYHTGGYLLRLEPKRIAAVYKGAWSGMRTPLPRTGERS